MIRYVLIRGALAVTMAGALAATAAQAQSPTPGPSQGPTQGPAQGGESEDSRYQFNRVEDGYLRLDLKSGQVSLCSRRTVGWSCLAVADE